MTNPSIATQIDLTLYPDGTRLDADESLVIGGCRVAQLAEQYGTPAYLIDEGALRARARRYIDSFADLHPDSAVLFASKSFPAASIVQVLADEGCGVDVAAAGELAIALAAGADPATMVLHGNAKTDEDIAAGLDAGVGHVVIDGPDDIDRLVRMASGPVPVLLRVSPALDAATHEKMMTGHDNSKFGIPTDMVPEVIARIRREPMLDLQGLHAHIGSQILQVEQFEAEVAALAKFERFGVYDLGGGLGVRYVHTDRAPEVEEYAERMVGAVHRYLGSDVRLMVEPGRSMIARNGVTVYRVVTVKHGPRVHVAVDGGMGDNLEVALYDQPFEPAIIDKGGDPVTCDVVGRHCESGDTFVRDHVLADPKVGDLLTIPVTGAYCYTMSNNYNGNCRPPVILCRDGAARVAVRRETVADLLGRDVLAAAAR
ncbi:MAG TPA: diaminopimelate decarboxylase [Nocardioides sp.]|jgi:diaminopimelate decarboxylase|uniref:diaminopimelate decarboxylase n=1 Tax=Nocardioides sp. TaxID=35761 RepID=UPI002E3080AD|nr:diaminopimelate decarboxylase [Nocardioides sp.]HEX3930764.1 diaminopimelate decarboxylase [Nocardioides sp.]